MTKIETGKNIFIFLFPLVTLLSVIPFFSDSFINTSTLSLSFFCLLFFIYAFKTNKNLKTSSVFWLFIVLGALSFANSWHSINLSLAIVSGSTYFLYACCFVFIYNLSAKYLDLLIKSLVFCSIFIWAFVLWSVINSPLVQLDNIESFKHIISLLGHKNINSAALVILVPILLYSIINHSVFFKLISTLSLIASLYTILILQARSSYLALIGFIILAILFFIAKLLKFPTPNKKYSILFFTLIALSFAFIAFNPFQIEFIARATNRLTSIFTVNESFSDANKTIHERFFLWKGTINLILKNFWLGVGAGNWAIAFPAEGLLYSRAEQGKIIFQRPHNDFLWVFSELGIFGFLAYLFLFFQGIKIAFKKTKYSINPFLFLSGIIVFVVISSFSFIKEVPFIMLILLVYMALIFRSKTELEVEKASKFKAMVMSLVVLFVFGLNIMIAQSQYYFYQAEKASSSKNWKQGIEYFQKANKAYFRLTNTATPIKWYEGVLWSNIEQFNKAKECFLEAKRYNPTHLQTLNNLGATYEILGEHDLAKKNFYEAVNMSPLFYDANINLSTLHYNLNELDAAFFSLTKVKTHQKIMDEKYYNNLEVILLAIVKQEFELGKISEAKQNDYLNHINFLKLSFIKSGPNYTRFIQLISSEDLEN